ncbi:MAG: hypothetical protein AAFX78_09600 [Cyanobacteria bacterium J06638_20]
MNLLTSPRVEPNRGCRGLGTFKPGGWLNKGLIAFLVWMISLLFAIPAIAEEVAPSQLRLLLLLMDPLDPEIFSRNSENVYPNVITSSDVSQVGLTIPSLWWVEEQFGDRLLENWAAFPAENGLPPRVDLMVNEQVWSIYQPIERYAFVNQFGTSAQDYGYITRVYDRRNDLLAAYLCDYQGNGAAVQLQDRCDLFLNWAGGPSLPDAINSQNAPSANTPSRFRR